MTSTSLSRAVHAATDVGRVRTGNEDSYYAGSTVLAVADGMGGHAGGEIASRHALGPIEELEGATHATVEAASDALAEAIAEANRIVLEHGQANPELSGMGTTLTAALVREDRLHVAHVGDSRAYLLRNGELTQLTSDHTLVEQMVRDGQISRAEAAVHPHRSVLTRAIGIEHGIEVDTLTPVPLQPGDQVLLCSDGLTGQVAEDQLARLLTEHDDGDAAVRALIDAANAAGGPDNITVVLLRVAEQGSLPAPPATPDRADDTARLDAPDGDRDGAQQPVTTRSISTSPTLEHSDDDWARQFNRYAQPQGADGGGGEAGRRAWRGLPRVVPIALAVVVLLGLLAGGGYALLSRAYFVGEEAGEITIFQGIPQSVVGLDLFWTRESTGLSADALPDHIQQRLEQGVTATSFTEAQEVVERYERTIEEAEEAPGGSGSNDDTGQAGEGSGS